MISCDVFFVFTRERSSATIRNKSSRGFCIVVLSITNRSGASVFAISLSASSNVCGTTPSGFMRFRRAIRPVLIVLLAVKSVTRGGASKSVAVSSKPSARCAPSRSQSSAGVWRLRSRLRMRASRNVSFMGRVRISSAPASNAAKRARLVSEIPVPTMAISLVRGSSFSARQKA